MIFVVFPSREAFDAFKAATPRTDENPFTRIGEPSYEFIDLATNLKSGRAFAAHGFTADECQFLVDAGANVRVGTIDGPTWPLSDSDT